MHPSSLSPAPQSPAPRSPVPAARPRRPLRAAYTAVLSVLTLVAACLGALAFSTPATAPTTQVTSFGSNPGNLTMYAYAPANLPMRRPGGRGHARLHADRERLLRQLRLAEVRRPVGLRARPAADRLVQQLAELLQLVRLVQGHPRQGRGGLRGVDGEQGGLAVRGRQPHGCTSPGSRRAAA